MKKISVDQAEDKKCKEISTQDEIMSFLGWKDSYKNQKSKIILKNSKTGEIWDTTSYNNFTNTTKVIKSSGKYYQKNIVGKSKLFEEEKILDKIKKLNESSNWNYSKFKYTGAHNRVTIICNELDEFGDKHGEFYPTPSNLLRGSGCPKCAGKNRYTTDQFIKKLKKIFGDMYEYGNVNYINNHTKVSITYKIHGDFLVTPNDFLSGHRGFPKCKNSKGELEIIKYLDGRGIEYNYQNTMDSKLFSDCPNKKKVEIDFTLEINNRKIWIEFNGEQHYKDVCLFHKDKRHSLEKQILKEINPLKITLYLMV